MNGIPWSLEENNFLIENYSLLGLNEIQKELNVRFGNKRSKESIQSKALKLRKKGNNCSSRKTPIKWSKNEDDLIIRYYSDEGSLKISEMIRNSFNIERTIGSIQSRAFHLGIKLSKDRISKNAKHNGNLEKKYDIGTIVKWKSAEDGDRLYIKIKDGPKGFIPYKHYLLDNNDQNKCVLFLDRDKTNYNLDNLKLVSRNVLSKLVSNHLYSDIPEITKVGITWCELAYALKSQGVDVEELINNIEGESDE